MRTRVAERKFNEEYESKIAEKMAEYSRKMAELAQIDEEIHEHVLERRASLRYAASESPTAADSDSPTSTEGMYHMIDWAQSPPCMPASPDLHLPLSGSERAVMSERVLSLDRRLSRLSQAWAADAPPTTSANTSANSEPTSPRGPAIKRKSSPAGRRADALLRGNSGLGFLGGVGNSPGHSPGCSPSPLSQRAASADDDER